MEYALSVIILLFILGPSFICMILDLCYLLYFFCLYISSIWSNLVLCFSNLWRSTSEEKRELERVEKPMYNSVRRAAEVHRQVQFYYVNVLLLKLT